MQIWCHMHRPDSKIWLIRYLQDTFFQDIDTFKNGMRKRDTLGEGMCSASHNISTSDGNSEKRIMYIVFVRSLLVTGHHKSQ